MNAKMSKEAAENKDLMKKVLASKKTTFTHLGRTYGFKSRSRKPIYMVTSVNGFRYLSPEQIAPTKNKYLLKRHKENRIPKPRCWGWVPTLEEARIAAKINAGDMAECCYYTHLVIEEIAAGIPSMMFSDSDKTWWYEWHVDPKDPHRFRGKWIKCLKPAWAEGICGGFF